jgi:hypothetical protein
MLSFVLFGCGAAAPEASSDAATDGEEAGSISLPLDATCSSTLTVVTQDFDPALGGHLGVVADAHCADLAPLQYRFTAINPKSKTLVLQDWDYSNWSPKLALPAGSPEGTYTLVAEVRRTGTTTVVAKPSVKTIWGRACSPFSVLTSPGSAPLNSTVSVFPDLYCPLPHEWRLVVAKPGGGSVTYPWQTGQNMLWDTTGLNPGYATLTVTARNTGNTVPDVGAKTRFALGPVCSAAGLTISGSGASTRTLAATATCENYATAAYRYSVTAPNGTVSELRPFDTNPNFDWNVSGLDGAYSVKVEVRAYDAPNELLTSKTRKINLGTPCTKLTLPDLWGQHLQSQPFVATVTPSCDKAEFQFQRRSPQTTTWTTVCPYSPSTSCDLNRAPAPPGDYVVLAMVRKQGSVAAYDALSSQREYISTDGRPLLRTFATQSSYNLSALSGDGRWVLGTNFRWSRSTGFSVLDRPDDAVTNMLPGGATDINDAGSIIVGWDRNTRDQPFRWAGNVANWLFPTLLFYEAHANATSAEGSVIVGSYSQGTERQAFRWTSAGGVVLLGDLPGGYVGSDARDVSGDGMVVVGNGRASDHDEGFRWTAASGMMGLGLVPGRRSFRRRARQSQRQRRRGPELRRRDRLRHALDREPRHRAPEPASRRHAGQSQRPHGGRQHHLRVRRHTGRRRPCDLDRGRRRALPSGRAHRTGCRSHGLGFGLRHRRLERRQADPR